MSTTWPDRTEYPFSPHYFDTGHGQMHYLDVGDGTPVVMVHGTPTWSFLYRHLIAALSREYRSIVPDHLGFGLSDDAANGGYRPADHAANLEALLDHLQIRDCALIVHDFGGPIGLSYAINHPANVSVLVITNTWLWSLAEAGPTRRRLKFAGSPVGRFLYKRLNFSPRAMIRMSWGKKTRLTRQIHQQYIGAFPTPVRREAPWVLAREALGSSDWYDGLWNSRAHIKEKPALLAWGLCDPAFGDLLPRWREIFPDAEVVTYPDAGHFVPDEAGPDLGPVVSDFLRRNLRQDHRTGHAGSVVL